MNIAILLAANSYASASAGARLEWLVAPPPNCIDVRAVEQTVESRLGRPVFTAAPEAITIQARFASSGGRHLVQLEIVTARGDRRGERELAAASCEQLQASLQVVIAVLLDLETDRDEVPPPATLSREPATHAPAPTPPPAAVRIAIEPACTSEPARIKFTATVQSVAGLQPRVAFGAALDIALRLIGPIEMLPDPALYGELYSSDLHIVDVASGKVTLLAKAMGFHSQTDADTGLTYLPFGEADLHHNYNTTVSPVAAGGYFWAFFDSLRNYGNLGLQHQLWGAAIDIQPDGSYVTDPSHPAFYVTGQQFGANNYRAFAARDACLPEGPCTYGIDCCSGFCSETCVPPPRDRCSQTDEHCDASTDCCEASDTCINGFCALVPLL